MIIYVFGISGNNCLPDICHSLKVSLWPMFVLILALSFGFPCSMFGLYHPVYLKIISCFSFLFFIFLSTFYFWWKLLAHRLSWNHTNRILLYDGKCWFCLWIFCQSMKPESGSVPEPTSPVPGPTMVSSVTESAGIMPVWTPQQHWLGKTRHGKRICTAHFMCKTIKIALHKTLKALQHGVEETLKYI